MPTVFKRLIPIRFVGAGPADSESEKSVPLAGMMTSPRRDRVAAALRSFPSPPAPPPTPVAMERPKSPSLDQKVRMRSFARETARTENICEPSASEPTFIEELKASIRDLNHCAANIKEELDKSSIEEPPRSGSKPDANNNEKHGDTQMEKKLEDIEKTVKEMKYMMFFMMAVMTLRLIGFL